MAFPAARMDDLHTCPKVDPVSPAVKGGFCSKDTPAVNKPHVGGAIVGDCSPDVNVNGKKAARAGDNARCEGAPPLDLIVTGASDVFINGRLAAVKGSKTIHGGEVTVGSADVNFGTAMAGASFGDAAAATKACKEAATKRKNYKEVDWLGNPIPEDRRDYTQGKDMNCGQESVRQLCMQKCQKSNQPSSDACKACNTSEDDWYAKYMKDEQAEHNKVNEEFRVKASERNTKLWNEKVLAIGYASTSRRSGGFDPKGSSWEQHQGDTLYLWSGGSISTNNPATAIVKIEKLPSKIDDPDKEAKAGQIGSYPESRADMLKRSCGIESGYGSNTSQGMAGDLANGKVVLGSVDVGTLNGNPPGGGHVVTVTQMQFDQNGNLVKVTLNDTANPNKAQCCGREITGAGIQTFESALTPDTQTNVV